MNEYTFPLIVGVGVVSIVILYMMSMLDGEKHQILKLISLFFVLSLLLIIPKSSIDASLQCESVVNSSTQVSATEITYTYAEFCFERDESTGLSFLQNMYTYFVLAIGYTVVYLGIWAMKRMADSVKRRGG